MYGCQIGTQWPIPNAKQTDCILLVSVLVRRDATFGDLGALAQGAVVKGNLSSGH
jgi:hypothetical protein